MSVKQAGCLKLNTLLFARMLCKSLGDMCGAQFDILEESYLEKEPPASLGVTVFANFTGAISGQYLLAISETVAIKLLGRSDTQCPSDAITEIREEYGGLLKETLNLAVAQSIDELDKRFGNLTFHSGTIIYGAVEFPRVLNGTVKITGLLGTILCSFSLNLANLKIGERLEEALREVEQKTSEAAAGRKNIELILELLPIGLCMIDRNGMVLPGYSAATASILGPENRTQPAGRPLFDVVGAPEQFRPEWNNWLALTFDKYKKIPFDQITALCILTDFKNTRGRVLKLNWRPMCFENEHTLSQLLVVIEDVTEKRTMKQHMDELTERHQENVEMISHVINLQPDEITDFIWDSSELVGKAQEIVQSNNMDREFINELFRTFHTLKGSSGQYQFKSLQRLAQKVEEHLKLFREDSSLITKNAMDKIKRSIEDARGYIGRIQDIRARLGGKNELLENKAHRDAHTVNVPLGYIDLICDEINGLVAECPNQSTGNKLATLRDKIASLKAVKLSFYHATFSSIVDNACHKTGKKARLITGDDIALEITLMRKLHQCLIHLINNAIDHGIEEPAQRLTAGKIETGLLILSGERINGTLKIRLSDDGRGLDVVKIRKRLISDFGLTETEAEALCEAELSAYLLKPGFSTKTDTTELSGRGVGLDFVNHTITEMGGNTKILPLAGGGTEVTLTLPDK